MKIKSFFLLDVNDKIFNIIEKIILKIMKTNFFYFSEKLDKKSKLRNFFEKEKTTDIIPCYNDNEISLSFYIDFKIVFSDFIFNIFFFNSFFFCSL